MKIGADMRILLAGGTGFTGEAIARALVRRGVSVRIAGRTRPEWHSGLSPAEFVRADLTRVEECTPLLEGVDLCIHLASVRENVQAHCERSNHFVRGNLALSLPLLEALEQRPDLPVVFVSSANISPDLTVEDAMEGQPVDGYVLGKLLCEKVWRSFSLQRRTPLLVVRPVGIYGPGDRAGPGANVIPALMDRAKDVHDTLAVWGSGQQKRSFLFAEDFAEAILRLIEADVTGIQYIAPPEVVTIERLAGMIRDIVHPGLPLSFDPSAASGAAELSLAPSHSVLHSLAWTPLLEGLRRTWEWRIRSSI
ncbi:MAG: NAD(P)-dependent oxidoreductase [Candidatus Peregrinibacteria bacterium]